MKHRILFVCLGNICRSPAADAILNYMVEKRGIADQFQIDSAGTYGGHAGDLPNLPMRKAGTKRGYSMTHRSRPFVREDFDRFDMILVMDPSNYKNVGEMAPDPDAMKKVKHMKDFCSKFKISHVPDPYRGDDTEFEYVLDILEDACEGLLDYIVEA